MKKLNTSVVQKDVFLLMFSFFPDTTFSTMRVDSELSSWGAAIYQMLLYTIWCGHCANVFILLLYIYCANWAIATCSSEGVIFVDYFQLIVEFLNLELSCYYRCSVLFVAEKQDVTNS